MPSKKLSPTREEPTKRPMKYGGMGFYTLLSLAAIASMVIFIVYAAESDAKYADGNVDFTEQEQDYGRMQIAAYATIITLLLCILLLLSYITYKLHHHL